MLRYTAYSDPFDLDGAERLFRFGSTLQGDLVADHSDPSTRFLIALFRLSDQDQSSHGRARRLIF